MSERINLDNISIVMARPRYPENIGSAARAMCNMGIKKLVVVAPENYDIEKVRKLATHAASEVVDKIELHEEVREALAPYNYVVGTTARLGGERRTILSPSAASKNFVAISRKNRVAVLFGPEDRGLLNDDIRLCHEIINIPTSDFSSLNVSQAVLIICYELFLSGLDEKPKFAPRLATRYELDGMYDQLKEILVRINYINPENPDYWMNKLRQFFARLELRAREVSIIRGICRQIDGYGKRCYKEGSAGNKQRK
ncbi:MAG: RNA methyltransferase [Desulfobacteraceae bacterium]|nr:MAG: RNA methyltransferase [Desulfobacteraceae bacterium]